MFHLAAFSESQDSGGLLVNVAAIADPSMTVSGDNIQIPDYANQLVGAMAIGTTITRAQLQSPSLRRTVNYEIAPLNIGAEPLTPPTYSYFGADPISLDVDEQLQALVAEALAGAERETVLVWLADGPVSPVGGEIYTVRVTAAATLTAFAWTNAALVFDQVLPVGRYAIVGAKFNAAGLLAFRFLFQGSTPRPGGVGNDTDNDYDIHGQRYGGWGVWGEFQSTTPPTVDFLSVSADASETGVLDLIKIG